MSRSRGLVPLTPLLLLVLAPLLVCLAGEVASRATSWTSAAAIGLVFALGVAVGVAEVVLTRRFVHAWRFAAAGVLLATVGGFATLYGLTEEGPRRDSSLVWTERGAANAVVSHARTAARPVIVDFTAGWCHPVVAFDGATPAHVLLRAEAARFVKVHVDATNDEDPTVRELEQRFGVRGLPAIVVLGRDGREAARIEEHSSPDTVRAVLESVE